MKTEKLSIRIRADLKKLLVELAEEENRTLSNYVNLILKDYVNSLIYTE